MFYYNNHFLDKAEVRKEKKLFPRSEHSGATVGSLALFLTTAAYNELEMTSICTPTTDDPTRNFLAKRTENFGERQLTEM